LRLGLRIGGEDVEGDHRVRPLERRGGEGRLYRCWCTRAGIREAPSAPHGDLPGGAYPGTCRELGARAVAEREAQARELIQKGGPATGKLPVILVGDLNSDVRTPLKPGDGLADRVLLNAGFRERSTYTPLSCCLNTAVLTAPGGGGKVSCLMAMPAASGLFHRAIVQSGSYYLAAMDIEAAAALTRKLLAALELSPSEASKLAGLPPSLIHI